MNIDDDDDDDDPFGPAQSDSAFSWVQTLMSKEVNCTFISAQFCCTTEWMLMQSYWVLQQLKVQSFAPVLKSGIMLCLKKKHCLDMISV